jgi:glycosyltransferase involved in cell wall biosynthesis
VTYNRAQLLPRTLNSILSQDFEDFELIISDDCSNDGTDDICKEYAARDRRIQYFRNDTNLGMPGNLNRSIGPAKGTYIANLHDGDVYHKQVLAKWKEALDTYTTAGFVFNAYSQCKRGTDVIFRESYPPLIPGRELGLRLLTRWDSCVFGTVMARRTVYQRLGTFDPRFGNYSDIDMWLRIAREYDVAYVNEPLIDLMPKDPARFYAFVHWQVVFWLLGIHLANLARYRSVLPGPIHQLSVRYPVRRRKLFLVHMLACLKRRHWTRAREGLAIWRGADDWLLRSIGSLLGRPDDAPGWYDHRSWTAVRLPQ